MKAVILSAGEGTRLRPFTVSKPKVMIPIANRPIVEYVVEALTKNGIRDIIMVVGYKKERIMSHFQDGKNFDVNITYVTQKKKVGKLGTAYALSMAKDHIDDEFLAVAGDNIVAPEVISDLIKKRKETSLAITKSNIPSKYGVVTLSGNIVKNIVEKPMEKISDLISTGIYSFKPDIFDAIDLLMSKRKYDLTSVIQSLIPKEPVKGIVTRGMWVDAVYPWDLLHVNACALGKAKGKTAGTIEKNVVIKRYVSIGEGSVIHSGSYILGPVIIGKGCEIGPNVCIYPSTSMGDNVQIQPFSLIEHSVIMSDVSIGPTSFISHSVIDDGVRLGTNFTVEHGDADIKLGDKFHKVKDIGTLIGEDTLVRDKVAASAGSIIGARCKIASLRKIEGSIPNRGIIV